MATQTKTASKAPAIAAGATVAGLAGGLALGSRMGRGRRKVLGLPIGRKRGALMVAEELAHLAREMSNRNVLSNDEVKKLRHELATSNRRSPLEVLLDGLTHRRGAHKLET